MIPRLLTIKKQLKAQKEYIEVAIKDANDSNNTNADAVQKLNDGGGGSAAKIVDFRVKLFKHQQIIQRLSGTDDNGGLNNDDTDAAGRAVKNGGGGGAIFTSAQTGTNTQETLTNSVFDGVDLNGTKKFLIGVNALLTQTNDISTNTSSATEAIVPKESRHVDDSTGFAGDFSSKYSPGGSHKINEEVLRGLLVLGNNGETGDKSLATNDGIAITEVKDSNVPAPTFADRGKVIRGFGLS